MSYKVERRIRQGLPQVGYAPYGQVHAHSTGNPRSTAQNEADYFHNKDIKTGFYTHVVGNGRVIQLAEVNRGAWDVGGGWNQWGYASVELIESHANKAEFMRDYKIYCELLHDLAKQAGLPTTVDQGNTGIITHNYASHHQPNNGSDHVDPIPYLAKWGINLAQFRSDVVNAKSNNKPSTAPAGKPHPSPAGSIDKFAKQGDKIICDGWVYVPQISGYNYAILLDEKGREIDRKKSKGIVRKDVNKALNVSEKYAFGLHAEFKYSQVKGKKVKVVFRRTQDEKGNVKQPTHDIFSGLKKF